MGRFEWRLTLVVCLLLVTPATGSVAGADGSVAATTDSDTTRPVVSVTRTTDSGTTPPVESVTGTTDSDTAANEITGVRVEPVNDTDGDGAAAAFRITVTADTSMEDTDVGADDAGEPYFEVEIDGRTVAATRVVNRSETFTTTIRLSAETLRELAAGPHSLSVQLWDQDDERDAGDSGDDEEYDEVTRTVDYEPPADLSVIASRNETVVGSPVSFRATGGGGDAAWTLVDAPAGSDARLRAGPGDTVTLRATEPGEYTVRVAADGETATTTVSVTTDSRLALLRRYAPRLHYAAGERYRPTRYEAFVANAVLVGPDDGVVRDPSLFTLAGRGAGWTLELNGDQSAYPTYDDSYPPTVYGSVTDIRFRNRSYTAVTYWLFYVYDPKQGGVTGLLAHQGDLETVTVLLNESGPQYVAASQHFGGELREWDETPRAGSHVHVYPAVGAHSNYLVNTEQFPGGIPLQDQFVDEDSRSTEPVFTAFYRDQTGDAVTLSRDGSSGGDYEIAVLTGRERWSAFGGSVNPTTGEGRLPFFRERWTNPGEWIARTAVPDERQLDAVVGNVSVTDEAVAATVANTGSLPQTFRVVVEVKPADARWAGDRVRTVAVERVPVGFDRRRRVVIPAAIPASADVRVRVFAHRPPASESSLDTAVVNATDSSPTPTGTPSPSDTSSATPTDTPSPSDTSSATATRTPTDTATATPTATDSPSATATPAPTHSPTRTATDRSTQTESAEQSPTETRSTDGSGGWTRVPTDGMGAVAAAVALTLFVVTARRRCRS